MKKALSFILSLALVISMSSAASVISYAASDDVNMSVTLDGDWHYKVYRTYDQMYQYLPYDMVNVVWEDNELAKLPVKDVWSTWNKVEAPYPNVATGGLFPITHDDESAFFPSWSESWLARTFDLPENFTEDENVTLLLGIIDDNDVVYINGTAVASSGFMDGNGDKILNDTELGGFDYKATELENQVQFEKSYWEVKREYTIPTDILNLGGENEIVIRFYNNNGYGGFYAGRNYAICGNDLAVRHVKGLPTVSVDSSILEEVVMNQKTALETEDIDLYAETISESYSNDGMTKDDILEEFSTLFDTYSSLSLTDDNANTYMDEAGKYWYSTKRTLEGINDETGEGVIISNALDTEICFTLEDALIKEQGNMSHSYNVSYESELFGTALNYGIYLPESYSENTDKEYPVVYLLHGINSSSSSFMNVDRIQENMDQWIKDGTITEMIVVMPDSGKLAFYRDTEFDEANANGTGPWETHLTTEIRNEVEANYRAISDKNFRGLTGISMGGYGAVTVGAGHPDLYSSVASHMGALDDVLETLETLSQEELEAYDFYIDCGLQDTMVDYKATERMHEFLDSKGISHGYDLRDGGHNSAFYMDSMDDSMKMHSDHFLANQTSVVETDPVASDDYYVVVPGDVLWKIARDHGTTWEILDEINHLASPHLIYAGDKIYLTDK